MAAEPVRNTVLTRRGFAAGGAALLLTPALDSAAPRRASTPPVRAVRLDALCYEPNLTPATVAEALAGGLTAAVFDINAFPREEPAATLELGRWQGRFARPEFKLRPILVAADFQRAIAEGELGIVLASQDASILGNSSGEYVTRLRQFHALGLRLLQLTHNLRTHWGDSFMEPRDGGLSQSGAKLIAAMNELGMIVDLSHCSRLTTLEAITASKRPCAITHAGCKALAATARNKSDEEIKAIGAAGGFFGVFNMTTWLTADSAASIDTVINHIDHAVQLIGPERVGFGSDGALSRLDAPAEVARMARYQTSVAGGPSTEWAVRHVRVPELNAPDRMARLGEGLARRGYSQAAIDGITGSNFVRLFAAVSG